MRTAPETFLNEIRLGSFMSADTYARVLENHRKDKVMRILTTVLLSSLAAAANAQVAGIPASDTLGAEDLYGNPSLVGGVANGGGTAHGIW